MAFRSLRSQLLVWVLAPLAVVAILDTWVTYSSAESTATLVQDRLLLGSSRTIAEQIRFADGHVAVTIPPAALEMLDAGYKDHVYYRVSANDGALLAGYYEMTTPAKASPPEEWIAFDSNLRGASIRVIAFSQPVFEAPEYGPVLIEVAQTLEARNALARQIWLHSVRVQLLMLLLVTGLLALGLRRGLTPLTALRDRMIKRKPGVLESIDNASIPSELRPIVAAMNEYVERLNRHMLQHSRFIADASHQLRTPLAVLNTQITYAMRQRDPIVIAEAMAAIRASVQSNIRLVNQLLAFTEAESNLAPIGQRIPIDATRPVCQVLEELALLAQSRRIDLGFESTLQDAKVLASSHMIHVIAANLIDNSIRYTGEGGVVTVRLALGQSGGVELSVVDNGPGIPEFERERVFERFYRVHDKELDGCGLGLSIVKEIAAVCDATVTLASPTFGSGLIVTVSFPAIPSATSAVLAESSAPSPKTAADAT